MRAPPVVVLPALLAASAAVAQADPAPTPPEPCDFTPPPPPAGDGAASDAEAPPFFGNLFLAAPPLDGTPLPRNVEIRLGGALQELAAGFWRVSLVDEDGATIPFVLDGDRIVVDGGLPADTTVALAIAPTDTHPCQGCFAPNTVSLPIGADFDLVAPELDDVIVHGFVFPSQEEQQRCGVFVGAGTQVQVQVRARESAFITVAGRAARIEPTVLVDRALVARQSRQTLAASFGADAPLQPGDPVVVVVTARDLAGNVSPPRVKRVRLRALRGELPATLDELPELACALDARPDVHVPTRLPKNPVLRVVFPLEESPLALRPVGARDGAADIALVPAADVIEDARAGHLFTTAGPVPAGAYDIVWGACPRCVCPSCNLPPRARIVLEDVVDEGSPHPPVIRAFIDDAAPAPSTGACLPDHAATVVVLAPGQDDVAGPADLVYDAVLRIDDAPPRPVGAGLVPFVRGNGEIVVRLPTAPFGRVVGGDFTLELTAIDTAGHRSVATFESHSELEGGCASSPSMSPLLLALLLRRRRR